ncbi:hypothetical protein FQA39_LY17458 [Lamprigera yunnana]|nr:hypothetical protein FQA39_LY17458 [Lamprigera yunnana]
MGKKAKKTRWRALALNGHQSDSEESCSKSSLHINNQYKYSTFFYSSHSSPVRTIQNDGSKSTRSNSTASEQKTTFNEDEYTRITTPRQDVLFKKGYLNKPKSYQTQTSTGTCSTNSTSTCTPDHQSADGTEGTDLEYESQFVFPNSFIDQNGIYYINSFEPFPFVVYNAPICYTEYPKAKRYSTDSLTESVSPHNEESGVTNASTQPSDEASGEEPRRQKKKRRRKISRSKSVVSENSTDSNEVFKIGDEETMKTKSSEAQNLLLQSLTKTYSLKPDAEEFVPRNLRVSEALPFDTNIQFLNIQPNFISLPFELQRPQFMPLNFIPPEPKLYPTYINVIPNTELTQSTPVDEVKIDGTEVVEVKKKNEIDIAKIVCKLEEAAKQQQCNEHKRQNHNHNRNLPRPRYNKYRHEKAAVEPKQTNEMDAQKISQKHMQEVKIISSPQTRRPRKANQWISVSRKKRKNKNAEVQEEEEIGQECEDDLFESFDVTQLVDVIPLSCTEKTQIVEVPSVVEEIIVQSEEKENMQRTKKKKKKVQKILIKKVMITDVLPPEQLLEVVETPVVKIAVEESAAVEENMSIEKVPVVKVDKKKKKKKKQMLVLQKIQSVSSSTTTLNGDDSYDFLVEKLEGLEQKTNIEISKELDRMIQQGMYLNLEEKIRGLNLDMNNDDFFKTYVKEKSLDEESQGSTSKVNVFTWNSQDFQDKGEDYQSTTTDLTYSKNFSISTESILKGSSQYPITRAVKEWMTKTRENSPDIEILKSPNTIYKEFYENDNDASSNTEDDITVWSVKPDNDITNKILYDSVCDLSGCDTLCNGHIEDCDEAIEVYESKYGKNEDFLKIKGEVDQRHKSLPRHGDLPYKAICCNLM